MAEILLFDGAEVEAARGAVAAGLRVVAFSDAAAARLAASGVTHARAVDALGDDPEMPLYRAAAEWTRAFGTRAKDASGRALRDALRYRSTTLWWWAELYLHHNTEAARRVRFLETLARVVEHTRATAVRTHGLADDETLLAKRFCAAHAIGFSSAATSGARVNARGSAMTAGLLEASKLVATAAKSAGGVDDRLVPGGIVFLSHAAFWKTRARADGGEESYEHYLDAMLAEAKRRGLPSVTLGVGPLSAFRARSTAQRWKERLSVVRDPRYVHINRFVTPALAASALRAFGRMVDVRRSYERDASLREAFSHRGVAFEDLSRADLGFTLLHQAPWAARCLLEFEAAFAALRPGLVCLYAESSGLGRAAIEAARERGVKTLGVQHGILYPNYFSYERTDEDVALGTPIPNVTAVYGADGVRLLEDTFRYPKGRVAATGSPRYDALAAEVRGVDRAERRRSLGLPATGAVLVLASRHKGIRDTHKASGPAFPSLLEAVRGLEGATLVVKPHPAEPKDAYDADLANASLGERVRVIADRPLTDILPAADLLVTVESLSATEALVANVPVVVLRHPSNLRDVVASGAALGVPDGADPGPAIAALLAEGPTRDRWRGARERFLDDVAHGVDGHALERLMDLVSATAGLI